MSIQKRPTLRLIQPIGFSGRLAAIRVPTMGKARLSAKVKSWPTASQALKGLAAPTDKKASAAEATNMAAERPPSDQASLTATRRLILETRRSRNPHLSCKPASYPTPLYRKIVCRALRRKGSCTKSPVRDFPADFVKWRPPV